MALFSKGVVYVGTGDGLFAARPGPGMAKAQLLGLQGKGALTKTVRDLKDHKRLVVGTMKSGIYRSDDSGTRWRDANAGLSHLEVWSLAQHPRSGEMYAGTSPSALFRASEKDAERWTELEGMRRVPEASQWTFPPPPHISHVKAIGLHFANPSLIFAAIEEGGIVRSLDGGRSWVNLRNGFYLDTHCVIPMPDNPAVLVCTTGNGVYRSTDLGDSFAPVRKAPDLTYMAPVVVHAWRPNVLFTAAAAVPPPLWRRPEGAGCSVYRSEDQGQSWHRLSNGLPERLRAAPRALALHPEDPDVLLLGCQDGSVWLSEDGGNTFREFLKDLPAVSSLVICVD